MFLGGISGMLVFWADTIRAHSNRITHTNALGKVVDTYHHSDILKMTDLILQGITEMLIQELENQKPVSRFSNEKIWTLKLI